MDNFKIHKSKYDHKNTEAMLTFIGRSLPHGSGIDADWHLFMTGRYRIRMQCSYHAMDENGMYDGWVDFTVIIDADDEEYFRLMFHGDKSRRMAEKYGLRDYLEQTIMGELYEYIDFDRMNWDSTYAMDFATLASIMRTNFVSCLSWKIFRRLFDVYQKSWKILPFDKSTYQKWYT